MANLKTSWASPSRRTAALLVIVALAAFLAGRAWAGGIPSASALTYSGTLEDASGGPLAGDHNLEVQLWSAASGGTDALCTTTSQSVTFNAGHFSLALPDACTDAVKASPDVWAEILVDGASLGRTKLGAVPYAVEAGHAPAADNAANATHATNADNASNAAHASNADMATSAQTAVSLTGPIPVKVGDCIDVPGACGPGTFNQPTYYLDRVAGACPDDHPVFHGFAFQRCGALGTADEGLLIQMSCCALLSAP